MLRLGGESGGGEVRGRATPLRRDRDLIRAFNPLQLVHSSQSHIQIVSLLCTEVCRHCLLPHCNRDQILSVAPIHCHWHPSIDRLKNIQLCVI